MIFNLDLQPYLQAVLSPARNSRDWQDFYTSTQAQLPLHVERHLPPQSDPDISQKRDKREQMEVLAGLRKYAANHVLLLGNPGSGKSTALRRLLWEEVERCRQARCEQKQITQVPVLLELRSHRNGSVLDWLEKELRSLSLAQGEIQNLLDTQCLLLLFDGLNELSSAEVWKEVSNFRENNLETPMIFTTRKLGAGTDLGIKEKLEMLPLSEFQVQQFIEKRLPRQSEVLLRQLQNRLRELAETPLLLKILCDVFVEGEQIPQNRGELFRKEFSRRYNDFKRFKSLPITETSSRYTFDLLLHLAVVMMQGDSLTTAYYRTPRAKAEQWIAQFLQADGEISPKQKSNEYLEDLLEHQLLQLASNSDEVEFHHQLFQEYYAAEWLCCQLSETTDEQLKCHYLNYIKWTEVIALTIGLLSDLDEVSRIVQLALDIDFFLGARLAGEVKPQFQEKTTELIDNLKISKCFQLWLFSVEHSTSIPLWLKVELLEKTRSKAAIPLLGTVLKNSDERIRDAAIDALGEIGSEIATRELLSALQHENSYVRGKVAYVLGEIGSEAAILPLLNTLRNEDEQAIQLLVANALGKITSEITSESENPVFQQAAMLPLYYIHHLLNFLQSRSNKSEFSPNIEIFEQRLNEITLDVFFQVQSSERFSISESLASALSIFLEEAAMPLLDALQHENPIESLCDALRHKNSKVRQNAAYFLGHIGSKKAVPSLINALRDRNAGVRNSAAKALGEIGSEEAVDRLTSRLQDKELFIRESIAEALGKVGSPKPLNRLWKLYLITRNRSFSSAISAIQNHCQFYNYEVFRQAKEVLLRSVQISPSQFSTVYSIFKTESLTVMADKPDIRFDQRGATIGVNAAFEGSRIQVNQNIQSETTSTETAAEICKLLDRLERIPPTTIEAQQIVEAVTQRHPVLKNAQAIELAIKNNPTLRDRLRAALMAGSLETVKVIFAPAGIVIETIRAWLNPD